MYFNLNESKIYHELHKNKVMPHQIICLKTFKLQQDLY